VLGGENALASTLQRALPESVSAVLAASLLFLLPAREPGRRTILQWEDARDVDWGTILLFGGGLSMGSLAFSTGLAQALGSSATAAIGQLPVWLIALVAIYVGEVLTEFMSNTATANMLLPLFLALGAGTAAAPQLAAIAATLGCSLAFCLPVATPPNAIVFGSGRVPLTTMIRAGVLLDLVAGVLTWALLMAFFG
jgi:sodium-dependent dicarboxylate transporter 2/3/5